MGRLDTFDLGMDSYWVDLYKNLYDILMKPCVHKHIAPEAEVEQGAWGLRGARGGEAGAALLHTLHRAVLSAQSVFAIYEHTGDSGA